MIQPLQIIADAYRPRGEKAAGFPPVVLLDTVSVSGSRVDGYYLHPHDGEIVDEANGIEAHGYRGLIVVADEPGVDSAIAHEWRHHWQWFRGWEYDGAGWSPGASYRESIIRYFGSSRSEMDALAYEAERVGAERDLLWLEWMKEGR